MAITFIFWFDVPGSLCAALYPLSFHEKLPLLLKKRENSQYLFYNSTTDEVVPSSLMR